MANVYEGFTRSRLGARWKAIHMSSRAWNEGVLSTSATISKVASMDNKTPTIFSRRRWYWEVIEDPRKAEELTAATALRPGLSNPRVLEEQLQARTGLNYRVTAYRQKRIGVLADIRNFLGA